MRTILRCVALGSCVLAGGLTIATPASASIFWNLEAEQDNAYPLTQMCMGVSGGAQGATPSSPGYLQPGTPIITWQCNGSPDQTLSGNQVSIYQPTVELFDSLPINYAGETYPACITSDDVAANNPDIPAEISGCPVDFGYEDGNTPADFVLSYVQDDPMGFPCYTIQNTTTGLYLGASYGLAPIPNTNPPTQVQEGQSVISATRTGNNDQVWCDHAPPNMQTGSVTPAFIVLAVAYAPPGKGSMPNKGSSVVYQTTTSVGSTVTTTSTDTFKTNFSASLKAAPTGGTGGVTLTTSATTGTTDTNSTDVLMSWTDTQPIIGQSDAVDHDYDQIWILINPIMVGTYTPLYPSVSGAVGSANADVSWQFGPAPNLVDNYVTEMVLAGELNRDLTWDPAKLIVLHGYDLSPDTDTALANQMLWADPVFNKDGSNGAAPIASLDTPRFQLLQELEYDPTIAPGVGYKIEQKTTNTQSTKASYSYSVAIGATAGFSFENLFTVNTTATDTWTWSSSAQTKYTNVSDISDTLTLQPPQLGASDAGSATPAYTPPGLLYVYEDMIYQTYAFTLEWGRVPNPIYDGLTTPPTEVVADGYWMHECPAGTVMVGANIAQNVFKCEPVAVASAPIVPDPCPGCAPTTRYYPTSPSGQAVTVHVCPFGSVMVGLFADADILLCQQMPTKLAKYPYNAITTEVVNDNTTDGTLHACEPAVYTQAMSGVDVANDIFVCAINPGWAAPTPTN